MNSTGNQQNIQREWMKFDILTFISILLNDDLTCVFFHLEDKQTEQHVRIWYDISYVIVFEMSEHLIWQCSRRSYNMTPAETCVTCECTQCGCFERKLLLVRRWRKIPINTEWWKMTCRRDQHGRTALLFVVDKSKQSVSLFMGLYVCQDWHK